MFSWSKQKSQNEINNLSSITLAFIGDAVYSLMIKQSIIENSDHCGNMLNKLASDKVNAKAQSKLITSKLDKLTEDELAVFKRARNTKKNTKAKNASVTEYNNATGLEAVIGYLYLLGKLDRLNELLNSED